MAQVKKKLSRGRKHKKFKELLLDNWTNKEILAEYVGSENLLKKIRDEIKAEQLLQQHKLDLKTKEEEKKVEFVERFDEVVEVLPAVVDAVKDVKNEVVSLEDKAKTLDDKVGLLVEKRIDNKLKLEDLKEKLANYVGEQVDSKDLDEKVGMQSATYLLANIVKAESSKGS